jgi:TonB family protein
MSVVLTVLLIAFGGPTVPASDEPVPRPVSPVVVVRPRAEAEGNAQTGRGAVAGNVRDADGGVIPGAAVTITSTTFERSIVTDARGAYRLTDLPPGGYELTVRLSGFSTARQRLQIAANEIVAVDIRLQVGRLTEAISVHGALPAGVTARPAPPWPSTPADYFDAAKIYYQQGRLSDAEAASTRALELMRAGRGAVAGNVRDLGGGTIPGAAVTITSTTFERSVVTDARGAYRLTDLPPGRYELTVRLSGFNTALHRLQIVANETVAADIRLQVGRLSETVLVPGALPAGVTARPAAPAPTTPADYFDAATIHYQQGRLSDAEAATARALELMRAAVPEAPVQDPRIDPANPIRVGGSIVAPRILKRIPPEYPPAALAAGIVGTVIVEAQVERDGRVGNVAVLRSIPGLDEAALAAVRQWVFTPTLLNKVPVAIAMTVSVTFTAK